MYRFFHLFKSLFVNTNLISTVLGDLFGGIVIFETEWHTRKCNNKQKEKHYDSMLYYDLKSIEYYEFIDIWSVDIRCYENWHHLFANCFFLELEYVANSSPKGLSTLS
ncbi:MAG: hypothetical protein RSA29_06465 [Clostridium sp.]|uniref:hypothetical protein n=1 Tax=Clostridium sp. TaxID=1506 RepID=UPI003043130B